jgi:hypothetical protein
MGSMMRSMVYGRGDSVAGSSSVQSTFHRESEPIWAVHADLVSLQSIHRDPLQHDELGGAVGRPSRSLALSLYTPIYARTSIL